MFKKISKNYSLKSWQPLAVRSKHYIDLSNAYWIAECTFNKPVYAINLVKSQKENQKFIKNFENSISRRRKKQERFLENKYFVHWASLYSKPGLSFTGLRYENN